MKEYIQSAIEVTEIARDAAAECYNDAKSWIGNLIARADEWLCDYGDD